MLQRGRPTKSRSTTIRSQGLEAPYLVCVLCVYERERERETESFSLLWGVGSNSSFCQASSCSGGLGASQNVYFANRRISPGTLSGLVCLFSLSVSFIFTFSPFSVIFKDHAELPGSIGTTLLLHSRHAISFDAGGGQRGSIAIARKGPSRFVYQCVIGGKVIPEAMSAAGPSAPSTLQVSVGAPAVCSFSRAPGDSGTRGSDLFNIGATDEHAPLTWYPVRAVEKGQPAGQPATHRRFRDFTDLDEAIKAAFSGHHLRSSLPKLPPKSSKLFYDHSDPKFQEQRRAGLDQWLNKLVNIPRVLEVPSVLPFLGIAAALREVRTHASNALPSRTVSFSPRLASPRLPENAYTFAPGLCP